MYIKTTNKQTKILVKVEYQKIVYQKDDSARSGYLYYTKYHKFNHIVGSDRGKKERTELKEHVSSNILAGSHGL